MYERWEGLDPETRRLIAEIELSMPLWRRVLPILVVVGTISVIHWIIEATPAAYKDKSPLAYVIAITATLSLGVFVYYARNVWRISFLYPPIEFGISIMLAYAGMTQTRDPLLTVITLLAAARVTADSIKHFREFRTDEIKRIDESRKA